MHSPDVMASDTMASLIDPLQMQKQQAAARTQHPVVALRGGVDYVKRSESVFVGRQIGGQTAC